MHICVSLSNEWYTAFAHCWPPSPQGVQDMNCPLLTRLHSPHMGTNMITGRSSRTLSTWGSSTDIAWTPARLRRWRCSEVHQKPQTTLVNTQGLGIETMGARRYLAVHLNHKLDGYDNTKVRYKIAKVVWPYLRTLFLTLWWHLRYSMHWSAGKWKQWEGQK